MTLRFDTDFEPHHGELVTVSPLLRRIVAPNPSKYTWHGTGTYVVGHGRVTVIDPGPDDPDHVAALLAALGDETVERICVTHTHADHSPGARLLAAATGAPVLAWGPHPHEAVGEGPDDDAGRPRGVDLDFEPDERLAHGEVLDAPDHTLEVLHTPGHISNHLCFALREEGAVLTGDHVMGWSTTVIPPPDGDIAAYLRSLELLLARDEEVVYPTHGGPRHDAHAHIAALREHRLERELQIVTQLELGPRSPREIVAVLYAQVRPELHEAAARSVLAHLRKLADEGRARPDPDADPLDPATVWRLGS
ncbi:MAG: MBL fold metallo-hydrolase [Actinomyces sp.]|nr:MAG: MBL fold metallo-hydrolase [Actinomyces sp.]